MNETGAVYFERWQCLRVVIRGDRAHDKEKLLKSKGASIYLPWKTSKRIFSKAFDGRARACFGSGSGSGSNSGSGYGSGSGFSSGFGSGSTWTFARL